VEHADAQPQGLSALPSDLFYTQVIDVNYQNGLVWSRNPQFDSFSTPPRRSPWIVPGKFGTVHWSSGGGGLVTLPAALATPYAKQLNDGTTSLSVRTLIRT